MTIEQDATGSVVRVQRAPEAARPVDIDALAQALEQNPSSVAIIDPTGKIVYANQRFAELTGCATSELEGRDISSLGRLLEQSQDDVLASIDAGATWQGEVSYRRPDGKRFTVTTSVSPLVDEHGTISCYLAISHDITQLMPPVGADATGDARADGQPPGGFVMLAQVDGTILFLNSTVPGLDREDAIGHNVLEFVPATHRDQLSRNMAQVFRKSEAMEYEIEAIGPYGATMHYAVHLGPVKRDGRVVAFSFVANSVTPHEWLDGPVERDALRDSGERFRLLSEASIEAVVIHEDGLVLDANPAFARMLGYDVEEVVGRPTTDFAAPESHDAIREAVVSGYTGPIEAIGVHKDGSRFPAEVRVKTIEYRGRRLHVTVIRDMSQRASNGAARSEPAVQDELSPREVEVLRLLADGLTNRQIATRLRVSARTVDHHVSHILNKLNVPNRTAAVVAAELSGVLVAHEPIR